MDADGVVFTHVQDNVLMLAICHALINVRRFVVILANKVVHQFVTQVVKGVVIQVAT